MGQLRKRRNKVKESREESTKSERDRRDSASSQFEGSVDGDDTSWKTTIRDHWTFPFMVISVVVFIPYGMYLLYCFLLLQRPDLVNRATFGSLVLRPPVGPKDPRQVLIIGTMSSGTTQTAFELSRKLKLEIGHENAETQWSFVRDGTVSWFHITRFLDWRSFDDPDATKRHAIINLCTNFTDSMGFHPNMYKDSSCSRRQKWNTCWARECIQVLHREIGCSVEHDQTCLSPFSKVLFQTRHPLRTIESLVTKFCTGGVNGLLQPAFVKFASTLFPHYDFQQMSCIEAAGFYVFAYYETALTALRKGTISAMYKVEETSPCDIAMMAGFGEDNAIYPPNKILVLDKCSENTNHDAKNIMESSQYSINKGQLILTLEDLLGGKHGSSRAHGDVQLRDHISNLCSELEYFCFD